MVSQQREIDELIAQAYVPWALERKKSILMYFLWWILLGLSQGKMTRYEFFHCKQAMGRRVFFFLLLIPSIVLMFLPYVKVLPVLLYAAMLVVRFIFAKQSRDGKYTSFKSDKVFLPLFEGIGGWIVDIFSFEVELIDTTVHSNDTSAGKTL